MCRRPFDRGGTWLGETGSGAPGQREAACDWFGEEAGIAGLRVARGPAAFGGGICPTNSHCSKSTLREMEFVRLNFATA